MRTSSKVESAKYSQLFVTVLNIEYLRVYFPICCGVYFPIYVPYIFPYIFPYIPNFSSLYVSLYISLCIIPSYSPHISPLGAPMGIRLAYSPFMGPTGEGRRPSSGCPCAATRGSQHMPTSMNTVDLLQS